jgi:hypothetical protein
LLVKTFEVNFLVRAVLKKNMPKKWFNVYSFEIS